MKLLLQAGVDVNSGDNAESDNKVLHWAASFADVKTLKLLLGITYKYEYSFELWPVIYQCMLIATLVYLLMWQFTSYSTSKE